MRFYKQKRFYIPLFILLILLIIATALLYRPLKLIYWAAVDFPKEEQTIREYDTLIANPSTFFANYTAFQPKLEDFQDLNKQIQNAKQDFIIMEKIGLGGVYMSAFTMMNKKFTGLSKIKRFFFGYPEVKNLNQSQIQQHQEILKNTQELKEAISKEQFQFAQAYEDFYQFLSENINDLVYTQKNNANRLMVNGIFLISNTYSDEICPPYEYIQTFLPRMQESYIILKELRPSPMIIDMTTATRSVEGLQNILSNCKEE